MHPHSLTVLELPRILALLEEGAISGPGKSLCRKLAPAWSFEEVDRRLEEVRQLLRLDDTEPLPLEAFADIGPLLERARLEGSILWPEELVQILGNLKVARRVRAHLVGAERAADFPLLARLGRSLPACQGLEEAIGQATGGKPELRDRASAGLATVRAGMAATRSQIHKALQGLMDGPLGHHLQDRLITLRNGRYVLPVRTDAKGAVAGIIHDYSHSKATAFIEPLAVVELNNEVAILAREERREEEKILRRLTGLVAEAADELRTAQAGLAHLDLLSAKLALGRRLGGVVVQLNRGGRLALRGAIHPLLLGGRSEPVPVDVDLTPETRTLIVSGPNAGGKTVTLKTVGLLALMNQAGLPIPAAEGTELPVFPEILATIGDEQDIEGALSTFSARMGRTKELLELAREGALVLLDEIGTGTDPAEGAALAMAVLDELIQRGACCLITTHYHLLKAYAFLKPGVANVSLEFDHESLRPTFRLTYGKPGGSHGLETAVEVGLAPELVERAKGYLTDAERKSASLISELEETLERLRSERGRLAQLHEEAEAVQERRSRELARLRERRDELLLAERRRAEDIIGQAEREVRRIKKGLKERKLIETKRLRQLRRQMDEALRVREQRREIDALKEGERVLVASLGKEAELAEDARGKDRVAVVCGGLRMQLPVWDLRPGRGGDKAGQRPPEKPAPPARLYGLSAAPAVREVNLVGMRVDEALPIVDKTLDLAVVGGVSSISIIHGAGTGRLRAAIRDHLQGHPQVRSFRPGEGRQAAGVTVVEVES